MSESYASFQKEKRQREKKEGNRPSGEIGARASASPIDDGMMVVGVEPSTPPIVPPSFSIPNVIPVVAIAAHTAERAALAHCTIS